ncbi:MULTISPECIES: hypothetical protein [unclassified Corallococcus]|uniref:hypothetical protein n=1 Tax=unclassified Corallococcus TaxID=2685029 RepID=UPI001A90105C|nr:MULTISPECIES: hypothetical protein [unclassified Corallococcus]MBN9685492.1 hypothetical protein [Corallococcus sp. NCSPR001]WAS83060.1 hypothetical protein O0N60_27510 [Corallococcus sp. NCRR]
MRSVDRGLPPLKQVATPSLARLREMGSATIAPADLDSLGAPNVEAPDVEEYLRKYGAPPGPEREWWLEAHCGLEFLLCLDLYDGSVRVIAEESAEFEHALAHLPFAVEAPFRMVPSAEERQRRAGHGGWVVCRVDTHGSTFEVESFSRERSARCFANLLEARGHKQGYFVEPRGVAPPLPSGAPGPYPWVLLRQDENGVRYEIERARRPERLEWLAEQYNKEPRHKQHWFVERLPPVTPAETSADR